MTQCSALGEAPTRNPSISSQALHSTTESPRSSYDFGLCLDRVMLYMKSHSNVKWGHGKFTNSGGGTHENKVFKVNFPCPYFT